MICFVLSGISPSNGSQDRVEKLHQKIHSSSLVQNLTQFQCIAFRRQVASSFASWTRETFDQRWASRDASPILELELKYTCWYVDMLIC
jgi:hypothetical protein